MNNSQTASDHKAKQKIDLERLCLARTENSTTIALALQYCVPVTSANSHTKFTLR